MKRTISIVSTLLLLVSCARTYKGELEITQDFTVKGKRNNQLKLEAGTLSATITIKSNKKIKLRVQGEQKGKVQFKLPSSVEMPEGKGMVEIASKKLKQSFDLVAQMKTASSNSATITKTEICRIYIGTEKVCRPVPEKDHHKDKKPGDKPAPPKIECFYEKLYRPGLRVVNYHFAYSKTFAAIDFIDPNSKDIWGHFTGEGHQEQTRIYDSIGACESTGGPLIHEPVGAHNPKH